MKVTKSLPKAVLGTERGSRMRAPTSGAFTTLSTSTISFAITGAGVRAGATNPVQDVATDTTG